MRLSPSAHLDTFCRDRLPPPDQWPEFRFDLPGAGLPRTAELRRRAPRRDRRPVRRRPALPAVAGDERRRGSLDLRRDRAADQPARPGADRGLRPAAGQPGPAPRPEHSLARRGLARRDQGGRGDGHHDGPAAAPGDRHHHRTDRAEPGPVRPPVHRRPGGRGAGADRDPLRRRRPGRPAPPACAAKDGVFTPVDTAADDVAMLASTSGTTGQPKVAMHFHRDVLATADTFSAT